MKKKLRIFFSDISNRIAVVVALALAQILFFSPVTFYKSESSYLYQRMYAFNPRGSGIAHCHFQVVDEDLEIIALSDIGIVYGNGDGRLGKSTNFCHTSYQRMFVGCDGYPGTVQMMLGIPYEMLYYAPAYTEETGLVMRPNPEATEDLVSYTGFILKKHGRIVGAELYKMYGTEGTKSIITKPVVIMEYPIISAGISEFAVWQKLQEIALIDRIVTLNSATEIPYGDPYWDSWRPVPLPNTGS